MARHVIQAAWTFVFVSQNLYYAPVVDGQYSPDEKLNILSERGVAVVRKGERHALYCAGHEPGMEWVDVRGQVVGGRGPGRRLHVEEVPGKLVLLFDDPQLADNGTWTCRAGDMERSILVYVVEEAQFESWREYVAPMLGSDAILTCTVRGVPAPQLGWYRNNKLLRDNLSPNKYNVGKGKLVIYHVSLEDGGKYECRARQSGAGWQHAASAVTRLLVRHDPSINGEPIQNVSVLYDRIRVLRCSAAAYPTPSYRWSRLTVKGEKKIPSYGGDIFTARNGSYSELTVRVNGRDDLGDYVCYAWNQYGQDKKLFRLKKGWKPEPPANVEFKTATNDSLLFVVKCENCTLSSNGTVKTEKEIGYRFELAEQALKGLYAEMEPVYWEEDREHILSIDAEWASVASPSAVRGLRPNTTYAARVASFNLAGPSDFVELRQQFTTTAGACALPPRAPLSAALLVALIADVRRCF